jgi:hypothetical protein
MNTWFLLDIAFYIQNLTQKDIFLLMNLTDKATNVNAIREMFETSRAMFVIALLGTFPGYWFTVFLIKKVGRFIIQLVGFFMLIIGLKYSYLKEKPHVSIFAVLYGLTFFFANFGPNSTTFRAIEKSVMGALCLSSGFGLDLVLEETIYPLSAMIICLNTPTNKLVGHLSPPCLQCNARCGNYIRGASFINLPQEASTK